jgi:hypothetical protein
MRILLRAACFAALAFTAWGQQVQEWRLSVLKRLAPEYTLTKASADRSTIVSAGSVVVLKKDGLRLLTTEDRVVPGNTYTDGAIKPSFLARTTTGKFARTFVAGEKLWVTKFLFEAKGDGVVLEFLSDPFDDVRYWGTLKLPFPKDSPPTPDDLAKTIAQIIKVDDSVPAAPQPTAPAGQPAEQFAPLAPPPPPPDQPPPAPKEPKIGMTIPEIEGSLGPPSVKFSLGGKTTYSYKDLGIKIVFTDGKVTSID